MAASKPLNKRLYMRAKSEAKRKFKVYPSAYANAWLTKRYKALGGKYSKSGSGKKRSIFKRSVKKVQQRDAKRKKSLKTRSRGKSRR